MINILVSACFLGVNCRYNGVEKENEKILELLKNEELQKEIRLIPVCPEQLGGLPTPRQPSEILPDRRVMMKNETGMSDGADVTEQYCRGAKEALKIARLYDCHSAILKERSPSCGSGQVYDGSFSGKLIEGDGITAALLKKHGIAVYGESQINEAIDEIRKGTGLK